MKALIICNDNEAINTIGNILRANNYETITYHWLLKALDNVIEICPDLVIISTRDYPRHWKTFSSFVQSNISGKTPQIILYTDNNFSKTEQKKAYALNIKGVFNNYDEKGIEKLKTIISVKPVFNIQINPILQNDATKNNDFHKCDVIFTHPYTDTFITGKLISFSNSIIILTVDIPILTKAIIEETVISELSIRTQNGIFFLSATVLNTDGNIFTLKIKNKHENS
jgi:hypothetical protein